MKLKMLTLLAAGAVAFTGNAFAQLPDSKVLTMDVAQAIVQEALAVVVSRKPVATAEFSVSVNQRTLVIEILSDAAESAGETGGADVHYLAAIEQRVAALGGELKSSYVPAGATSITATIPLESTLQAA